MDGAGRPDDLGMGGQGGRRDHQARARRRLVSQPVLGPGGARRGAGRAGGADRARLGGDPQGPRRARGGDLRHRARGNRNERRRGADDHRAHRRRLDQQRVRAPDARRLLQDPRQSVGRQRLGRVRRRGARVRGGVRGDHRRAVRVARAHRARGGDLHRGPVLPGGARGEHLAGAADVGQAPRDAAADVRAASSGGGDRARPGRERHLGRAGVRPGWHPALGRDDPGRGRDLRAGRIHAVGADVPARHRGRRVAQPRRRQRQRTSVDAPRGRGRRGRASRRVADERTAETRRAAESSRARPPAGAAAPQTVPAAGAGRGSRVSVARVRRRAADPVVRSRPRPAGRGWPRARSGAPVASSERTRRREFRSPLGAPASPPEACFRPPWASTVRRHTAGRHAQRRLPTGGHRRRAPRHSWTASTRPRRRAPSTHPSAGRRTMRRPNRCRLLRPSVTDDGQSGENGPPYPGNEGDAGGAHE